MARKKNIEKIIEEPIKEAEIQLQRIDETLEKNFMPYAMSVIVARAIPEIDGFKPAHRKLLYTMYDMGLLNGPRTKCANIVGATMRLNPHGDAAIYDTLVRLTRDNETLIHPFIDSKGSFGKHYSTTDMECAASRYTEAKLDKFCTEIFTGISNDAVDMVDNYDSTMKEPALLPTSFPNILVSPNKGIAVAMSSSICSFNLAEVCDGAIQMLRAPESTVDQMLDIIKAPDFQGGGLLIYNREQLREVYRTGRGSVRLRARYNYDKNENCIEITQIPYSTSLELIIKKLTALCKEGKLKEVTDFRDEIGLAGFKLTIDVKRGTDPDKLMAKLFKMTPLEDSFDCNFTVLVDGSPRLMGICEILTEWIRFRMNCIQRIFRFDLNKKKDRLHLLLGLGKILLDIDKAVKIVRTTEKESEVVKNLMEGFGIDEIQAEYIAEIKLRHLNREYILNRLAEIEGLEAEIADIEDMLKSERRQKDYIASQLREIKNKYAIPRQTQLIYDEDIKEFSEEDFIETFNVRLFMTREGYFKKIALTSLRASEEHKLKPGDEIAYIEESTNVAGELLFFSDKGQAYKARVADFDVTKASALGDYIPAKLGFDEGEKVVFMKLIHTYNEKDNMIFIFENGKGVRVPVISYQTKSNRRKLTNAYSTASPLVAALYEDETKDLLIVTNTNRAMTIKSSLISLKTTRISQGVQVFTLKRGAKVTEATFDTLKYGDPKKYRKIKIPSSGNPLDDGQTKFDID